jgi:hypothetical protein
VNAGEAPRRGPVCDSRGIPSDYTVQDHLNVIFAKSSTSKPGWFAVADRIHAAHEPQRRAKRSVSVTVYSPLMTKNRPESLSSYMSVEAAKLVATP